MLVVLVLLVLLVLNLIVFSDSSLQFIEHELEVVEYMYALNRCTLYIPLGVGDRRRGRVGLAT